MTDRGKEQKGQLTGRYHVLPLKSAMQDCRKLCPKTKEKANDLKQVEAMLFAKFFQAYMECGDEIQAGIRDMVGILNDPEADEQDKTMALHTLADAIFPDFPDGRYGLDLEEAEETAGKLFPEATAVLTGMDAEEREFADRLRACMSEKPMTQEELAAATGVGQSAISMMLTRNCRPQRRTVEKLAKALQVSPAELWPNFAK